MSSKQIISAIYSYYIETLPKFTPPYAIPVRQAYSALGQESQLLADKIPLTINEVSFSNPYIGPHHMFFDISHHSTLRISATNNNHPLLSEAENIAFRIVHDYHGHYNNGENNLFSWDGEIAAYQATLGKYSPLARAALFTEVVGQTAYRSVAGEFPPQVAFLYSLPLREQFDNVVQTTLN